jgi:hypothetical protein
MTILTLLTASGDIELNGNSIALSTPTITLNGNDIDFWVKKGAATSEDFYIGNLSGNAQTAANDNIGIGNNTLELNETGSNNIAIGAGAGKNVFNCSQNIAIGGLSGVYKSGVNCVNNIAIGFTSQQGVVGSNGQYNSSLGSSSLYSLTSGSFNTAIGVNAGFSLTTGNDNTFVGAFCADGSVDDVGNTAIGRNCYTNGGTNRTCLGKLAETDADNQVCIGNSSVVEIRNLGNNTCDLGSVSHKFKDLYLGGTILGMPYDFSFSCSNEISTITSTGQKMSVRCPRNFQSTNLKISVNSAGGAGFAVVIKKNGVIVATVAQGTFLITNTADTTVYSADDIITVEVSNTGSGTATGLKVYINGKTN